MVDALAVELDPDSASEFSRSVPESVHRAAIGQVVTGRTGDDGNAQRQVDREFVGSTTQDVALIDERRHDAGKRRAFHGHHAGEPRVNRQCEHVASERRECSRCGIEGVEVDEQIARLAERCGRRVIDEGQATGRLVGIGADAPRGELEHQSGEIGLEDLGCPVLGSRPVFELAPEAVGGPGLGASRPSGALLGRSAARCHRGESSHTGPRVEPRFASEARIDDDADTVDRQRGLRDVGAQHDASTPGR